MSRFYTEELEAMERARLDLAFRDGDCPYYATPYYSERVLRDAQGRLLACLAQHTEPLHTSNLAAECGLEMELTRQALDGLWQRGLLRSWWSTTPPYGERMWEAVTR